MTPFDYSRSKNLKHHADPLFTIAAAFIVFVFVCIVLWYTLLGIMTFKIVDQVDQHGLKSVIEQVWEGPKQ